MADPAVADELWAAFTTAGFTCWVPDAVTVRPLPPGRLSGTFPLPAPATFLTADNPGGGPVTDQENVARRRELATYLDAGGYRWHLAVGGDPDGENLEPGALLLGLDLVTATRLGARFEQAAVYVWERHALHLVACAGTRHDVLGYRATPGTQLRPPVLHP